MTKIPFIMLAQFPPPAHGAALMSKLIAESSSLNARFEVNRLPLNLAGTVKNLHRFSFAKLGHSIKILTKLLGYCFWPKPAVFYYTPNFYGKAFYRDIILMLIIRLTKQKHIFHLHGKLKQDRPLSKTKLAIIRFVFKNAEIIFVGKHLANTEGPLITQDKSKTHVLHNTCQTVRYAKKSQTKTVRLLFLSTLMPSKGIYVLLNTIASLNKKRGLDFHLDVVGSTMNQQEQENLLKAIDQLGISRCLTLHGPIYGKAKKALFEQADIFVHPTLNDSFGIVILEAMQAGLAIVATKEGTIPEIITDQQNGFLVEKQNSTALAKALAQLIKSHALRQQYSLAATATFTERFSPQVFERALETLLQALFD